MMGTNSPTAPLASTWVPNGESSSPASLRIGISVPTAVVVSAIATGSMTVMAPISASAPATAAASARDTAIP